MPGNNRIGGDKTAEERRLRSDLQVLNTAKYSKYFKQPYNYNDHDYCIKNVFDCPLYWNIIIHQPEDDPCNNQYDKNS